MEKIYIISNRKMDRHKADQEGYLGLFHDSKFHEGERGPMEVNAVSIDNDKEIHYGTVKGFFKEIQERMKTESKNSVFFIHGFNNSWEESYNRIKDIGHLYNVIPIIFTWPTAMDGNKFRDYREKKGYAMNSSRALDRVFEKINECFEKTTEECGHSLNLAMHSMGNYLFKGLFTQGHYAGETRIFDNVIMLAADINNKNHKDFVDRIKCRGHVYVTINRKDKALGFSSFKLGKKQGPRLGEYLRHLDADALYIDITGQPETKSGGGSHSYFSEIPPRNNNMLMTFFEHVFNGRDGEDEMQLKYDNKKNVYKL